MATCSPRIEVQLVAGVWTDISDDMRLEQGCVYSLGVKGTGPLDVVATSGELAFTLRNDAGNSGGVQGYYSPGHTNKRTGWAFGIPVRLVVTSPVHTTFTPVSITRSGAVATIDFGTPHNLEAGQYLRVQGATQSEYNGLVIQVASVPTDQTATFAVTGSPASPATGTITVQRTTVRFYGKVRVIEPEAGRYGSQRVRVVAYDIMRDLAEADLRSIGIQTDKTEAELVEAVLDAVPASAQPPARIIDPGIDTFAYSFDDLGSGTKALTVIGKAARSSLSFDFARGDGTFIHRSRHERVVGSSLFSFNDTMHGLQVPSSMERVYNLVRTTIRPKTVTATYTDVLCEQTGTAPAVQPGETITTWFNYTDPNDRQVSIGGIVNDPPVSQVDFLFTGNSAVDGSGANRTSDLSASILAFATTVRFSVTNTSASVVYVTSRQVLGKGVFDNSPQTFEASSVQDYGVRELQFDMEYQDDPGVAQSAGTFIEAQYRTLESQPQEIRLLANDSDTLMRATLEIEPGDRITITETMTGLTAVDAIVHWVACEFRPGPWVVTRLGLAPASPWRFWRWGIEGSSNWGLSTVYGW